MKQYSKQIVDLFVVLIDGNMVGDNRKTGTFLNNMQRNIYSADALTHGEKQQKQQR